MIKVSELVQLKLNIETRVQGTSSHLQEVGVLRVDKLEEQRELWIAG